MAKIRFIQPGEPPQKKNSIPSGTYRKRWKIAFIISGVMNVLFISFFIYKYISHH